MTQSIQFCSCVSLKESKKEDNKNLLLSLYDSLERLCENLDKLNHVIQKRKHELEKNNYEINKRLISKNLLTKMIW